MSTSSFATKTFSFEYTSSAIASATQLSAFKTHLPILPEMLFLDNRLEITTKTGRKILFCAKDALDLVESTNTLQVASAEKWQRSQNKSEIKDVIKPFDWTFTTAYTGTLCPANPHQISEKEAESILVETTREINFALLKRPDPILFYGTVVLYEDELADNGVAMLSARIRVMESCFLVLLRFFLRVDGVLIRIIDTRLFWESGIDGILRTFVWREMPYEQVCEELPLNIWNSKDHSMLTDENWIASLLEAKGTIVQESSIVIDDE